MREIMKGRKKASAVKPPAELEKRPGDIELPPALYLECVLFKGLPQKPNPDKLPGTLRLRSFKKGELICREGDPGWTAFVILSADDVANIRKAGGEGLPSLEGDHPAHREEVATVFVRPRRPAEAKPTFWQRWFGNSLRSGDELGLTPYGLPRARLRTGSIFGDWSCIYGVQRAATIQADRGLFVLEMLRNVLDTVQKNPRYQEQARKEYVENTLQSQLAALPVFRSLPASEVEKIRLAALDERTPSDERIELRQYKDGDILFNKGDPPDGLYIVQRGLIKIQASAWPLLSPEDILDEPRLRAMVTDEATPHKFLAARLNTGGPLAPLANELIKDKALTGAVFKANKRTLRAELASLLQSPAFLAAWEAGFPEKPEDWADRDWRRFNRLVLESAFPGTIRGTGPGTVEHVLNYAQKGDFFGEIGVLSGKPRSATCVAYVHPRPSVDGESEGEAEGWRSEQRVEVVRLPRELILKLCDVHTSIRAELVDRATELKKQNEKSAGGTRQTVMRSHAFQEQGLIQGQKLMLIDLDRCTRCDECVKACVATHDDGRTRLFLDGPRFGKYLVPATCRSCRDPVCLISCPVGSIRRGKNLEIVIEDWCIGCGKCADNCPYGSIQMHDTGLVPEQNHDWVVADGSGRRPAASPIRWDGTSDPMTMELEFPLEGEVLSRSGSSLKLTVGTEAAEVKLEGTGRSAKVVSFLGVWINSKPVPAGEWKPEGGQFVFEVPPEKRAEWFRPGWNLIAVKATPGAGPRGLLLALALDEVKPVGVIAEKAVVCDQCSTLPAQLPACVHACPHDAAMRVDAWTGFPVG